MEAFIQFNCLIRVFYRLFIFINPFVYYLITSGRIELVVAIEFLLNGFICSRFQNINPFAELMRDCMVSIRLPNDVCQSLFLGRAQTSTFISNQICCKVAIFFQTFPMVFPILNFSRIGQLYSQDCRANRVNSHQNGDIFCKEFVT